MMTDTLEIKRKLYNGFFHTGDGGSKDVILIQGSCRCVPYLNYISEWNKDNGQPFLIYFIDPFDYHWDSNSVLTNLKETLTRQESNTKLLDIFSRTTIYIHEHYKNFGVFNTSKKYGKNIYDYGMSPSIDISIPNWHNSFVLMRDIHSMYKDIDNAADAAELGKYNIESFQSLASRSSVPEFASIFADTWRKKRLFGTFNHTTNEFSRIIWELINDKFLKLRFSESYIKNISGMSMYATGHTKLTQQDRDIYGIEWTEPTEQNIYETHDNGIVEKLRRGCEVAGVDYAENDGESKWL